MSETRKYFTITANDAGTEAYTDKYVKQLEQQIADLKRELAGAKAEIKHINNMYIEQLHDLVAKHEAEIADLKNQLSQQDFKTDADSNACEIIEKQGKTIEELKKQAEEMRNCVNCGVEKERWMDFPSCKDPDPLDCFKTHINWEPEIKTGQIRGE